MSFSLGVFHLLPTRLCNLHLIHPFVYKLGVKFIHRLLQNLPIFCIGSPPKKDTITLRCPCQWM